MSTGEGQERHSRRRSVSHSGEEQGGVEPWQRGREEPRGLWVLSLTESLSEAVTLCALCGVGGTCLHLRCPDDREEADTPSTTLFPKESTQQATP